ncbi:hypothetical protein AB6G21_01910 [Providencia hangzhouensis]|uniref:hypothetical protein n=1 Tax=Providencia hangzhouensis TaxID=3031799 RepID=UPI0034DD65AD
MNNTIHVIVESDNVFKNKLKLMMESFGFIFRFYNNEEVFMSNYTYPNEINVKECILLFLNNDENRINRLNNINNSFGIVPFIVLAKSLLSVYVEKALNLELLIFFLFLSKI